MNFFYHRGVYIIIYGMLFVFFFTVAVPMKSYAFRNRYFYLERPRHSLSFTYEFEHDRRTGSTREEENTTSSYEENLDIETGGWVIYPRLLTYSLRLSPQWEQEREHRDNELRSKFRSAMLRYDANITLLPYKPYTLYLGARKSSSTVTTTFVEKNRSESDSYSAGLSLKYDILPTYINYSHHETTQSGFFSSTSEGDSVNLTMNYSRHLGNSQISASYQDRSTSFRDTTTANKNQDINFTNDYSFNKSITLNSTYSYDESQSGASTTRGFDVRELLKWDHGENLRTRYSFRYDNTSFDTFRQESGGIGFDLSTDLFEDLSTTFSANSSKSRSSGSKERIYGTALNLGYKKDIPWGQLKITTGHRYSLHDRSASGEFEQFIDESVTLTTGTVTPLNGEHVVIESIVVTNSAGTITYIQDLDYRVREVGASTIISRVTVGAISDGDTVLVDYAFQRDATYDFALFSQSYQTDLFLWSTWRVYYGYNHSTQKVISGVTSDDLSDSIIHTAGTDLKWKWSKTAIEYDNRDIRDLPSESLRINETITVRPNNNISFGLSGGYGVTKFKNTGETTKVYTANSGIQWFPARRINISAEFNYTKLSGDTEQTTDTGFSTLFRYLLRAWLLSAEYEFANLRDAISGEEIKNNRVIFKIAKGMF